jgi:aerobic carbon-monoxide dehydrogenase medium subunit
MKPPAFAYAAARSIEEAVALLSEGPGEPRILAGGQSLVPMMNFRLAQPDCLIDINRVAELSYIRDEGQYLAIGAMTREYAVETSPVVSARCPVLAEATRWIGHPAIRHRGTIGGSLAHNDPSAEYPVIGALLEIELVILGPAGRRLVPFADFSLSHYVTSLEQGDLLVEVQVPVSGGQTGASFLEVARRHGDFALVSAGAVLAFAGSVVRNARLALGGVGATPVRARSAEAALQGRQLDEDAIRTAADLAAESVSPPADMHGSAEFRRHLCRVLTARSLREAGRRAGL